MSHIFLGLEHRNESMFAVSLLLKTLMVEVAVDCFSVRCTFSFHPECCPGAYGESEDYITTVPRSRQGSRQVSSGRGVRMCALVSERSQHTPKGQETMEEPGSLQLGGLSEMAADCDESVYLN